MAAQALAAHIGESLPHRSVQSVRSMTAPVQEVEVDRGAVLRTLKGLVTDILGAEVSESEPFMEVCSLGESSPGL